MKKSHLQIRVANGALCQADKVGPSTQIVKTRQSGFKERMVLKKVLYSSCAPKTTRLYSVRQGFEKDGIRAEFNGINRLVLHTTSRRRVSIPFATHEKKYLVHAKPADTRSFTDLALKAIAYEATELDALRHARYAHFSHVRTGVRDPNCEACRLGGGMGGGTWLDGADAIAGPKNSTARIEHRPMAMRM